jgi:ribosomal protein S18 acetylase RimI-like enzyme
VFDPRDAKSQIKTITNKTPTYSYNINEDLTYIDENRSKATTKDGREFTIWTEVEDSHDGQLDKLKIAYVGDDWMDENDKVIVDNLLGYVDYSVYNNSAYINFIKVKDSERRKGVGTALIKSLEHDHKNVNWGYTTDEGELLRKSIKGE